LIVEAIVPIRIRHEGQERKLIPGSPIDLPEFEARQLIRKAAGRVRSWPARGMQGAWIRWNDRDSQVCEGQVAFYAEDGWVVVHETSRAETVVFLRVDGNVQMGRDSASC
jgi:hypothetical protein